MEIMPLKFRSPPPKPPRRRHSDQLAVSSTGTYPSSGKKYLGENKLYLKDAQVNNENDKRCGSLPASWIDDFSLDQNIENSVFLKNTPLSSHLKNTYKNFQVSAVSVDANDFTERMTDTNIKKKTLSAWTRNGDLSFLENATKPIVCSTKYVKNFPDDYHSVKKNGSNSFDMTIASNRLDSKSFARDYHRRHHSDPVLSFLDKSNSKIVLQKYALRSNSFLENSVYDTHNRLCDSLITPFKSKEYEYLHEEMKNLKDINNKLWQHLCSTQVCLEKLKKDSEENSKHLSIADLLTSLYSSQRAKDNAMEDRMKVIIEERDAAIQELEDMVQIIARSFENDTIPEEEKYSDMEIKELLKEIELTYNPAKLLQQQRLLLTYLYRTKELKQDHIMHELKLAISERDHLHEKVKYLEEELKSQQVCSEVWNADNKHWENNLLKILCQVIHQRDVALSQVKVMQNTENVNYRHDGINNAVKKNFRSSYHDQKYEQFLEPTSDEIRMLKGEIMFLSKALEMEAEKRESAEEKCLRLERLVNVLRKKVNGKNVGIPV